MIVRRQITAVSRYDQFQAYGVALLRFTHQYPIVDQRVLRGGRLFIAGLLQSPDPAKGEIRGLALRYIRLVDTEILLRSQG